MKPQFLKINNPLGSSINIFDQKCQYFPTPWHYHPELELVLIQQSEGEKYIGSSVTKFMPGDLCLIGSFLPHTFKNCDSYYHPESKKVAESIVVHFNANFLGEKFFDIPECQRINLMLCKSEMGIQFDKKLGLALKPKIENLKQQEGLNRLLLFIEILDELSQCRECNFLTANPINIRNEVDSIRIKKVLEFLSENFKTDIKLEQVADLANLSESAFSRYFKTRTKRNFSQFLSEIRIDYACKLLQKEDLSVSQISYECGFNNLSNFNRQFKTLKNTTPLAYRMKFLN